MTVRREFELSEEQAAFIDKKVAASDVDADRVVQQAISMLQAEDEFIERWVKEEVLPTHERWKAGLEQEYTLEEVREHLEARRDARAQKKAS